MKKAYSILFLLILIIYLFYLLLTLVHQPEPQVKLYLNEEKKVVVIPLETYLVGVVAAEMGSSFHIEALKAQAVAARTYTLMRMYQRPKHPKGAQLCDDFHCCQAYRDPQKYRQLYGSRVYHREFDPIIEAVKKTRGEVMVWQGKLIDPPYFSTCGGRTASAREVWGRDIPYLQSVPCDSCAGAEHFNNKKSFALKDINRRLGFKTNTPFVFKVLEMSDSQRVKRLAIDSRVYSAEEIRKLFDLTSTKNLYAVQKGDEVIFTNRGYGHGVGMCQNGANGLAKKGKNYQQILRYYYSGIRIIRLNY